mgnify:CR=1 FL=1
MYLNHFVFSWSCTVDDVYPQVYINDDDEKAPETGNFSLSYKPCHKTFIGMFMCFLYSILWLYYQQSKNIKWFWYRTLRVFLNPNSTWWNTRGVLSCIFYSHRVIQLVVRKWILSSHGCSPATLCSSSHNTQSAKNQNKHFLAMATEGKIRNWTPDDP